MAFTDTAFPKPAYTLNQTPTDSLYNGVGVNYLVPLTACASPLHTSQYQHNILVISLVTLYVPTVPDYVHY